MKTGMVHQCRVTAVASVAARDVGMARTAIPLMGTVAVARTRARRVAEAARTISAWFLEDQNRQA